jgi:prepilin-type processing-associated H-X9-DG protein
MIEPAPKPNFSGVLGWIVGMILLALLGSLAIPGGGSRRVAPVGMCRFNLMHIGTALSAYHDDYGSYPPAYVSDANDKPIHSWRTLLLPYLYGGGPSGYSFDEPWDGPGNILLAKSAPREFQCPAAAKGPFTNYVAVTGSGTVFDGPNPARHSSITANPAKTIMLVEIVDSDIPWTAPRDLSIDNLNLQINADKHGISSNHAGGMNVLFCGGSNVHVGGKGSRETGRVDFLSNSTTPAQLKAMLMIRAGEP